MEVPRLGVESELQLLAYTSSPTARPLQRGEGEQEEVGAPGRGVLCPSHPCLHLQKPCAELQRRWRCRCPGLSGEDTLPEPPKLRAVAETTDTSVLVRWCAPNSVVRAYQIRSSPEGRPGNQQCPSASSRIELCVEVGREKTAQTGTFCYIGSDLLKSFQGDFPYGQALAKDPVISRNDTTSAAPWIFFFFFFFFFFFALVHFEVPRPGLETAPQLWRSWILNPLHH
uniref:Fibronectin type-III domain-containing protein n=1 Tax=Sus scrofa TaxID=9823 RepID=A0A5G2R8V4_PIG